MAPIRTVLHPTDFSQLSEPAFRMACALARDYDARLILLHVGSAPIFSYIGGFLPAQEEDLRVELKKKLMTMRPEDPDLRVDHVLVMSEDAAGAILETARTEHADLIVLGTHGWSGVSRLLMGSVAEHVVRKASCPVLTVRMPLEAEALEEADAVAMGRA